MRQSNRPSVLVAIPVFNEQTHVERVVAEVAGYARDILIVDDGSTDRTPEIVRAIAPEYGLDVVREPVNRGYGRSMQNAFRRAQDRGFDWVITIDCDEQHEPVFIPAFMEQIVRDELDIVSGSRYMDYDERLMEKRNGPPPERRAINHRITAEINERLGLTLTDSFCGFKAYRVDAVSRLRLTENGYAFPMQFWVQAVAAGLRIGEMPVSLIYTDEHRSFGGGLDDPSIRLNHYRRVLHCELKRCAARLPDRALIDTVESACA